MYTFIGCSGFHYDDWKGSFYPADLSTDEWLPYYARHFQTVEINNSFYRLPKTKTLKKWHEQTPRHFRFTMKGSRYITHQKKLVQDGDLRDGLKKFYDVVEALGGKLGCVLWQLPGNLHRNDEKLDKFCTLLSNDFKNVIEFRHNSWFTDETYRILSGQEVGFCMISAPDDLPDLAKTTGDTGYLRFHGKDEWYKYDYTETELDEWAQKLGDLNAERCYIYFNNDYNGKAIGNALLLKDKLEC